MISAWRVERLLKFLRFISVSASAKTQYKNIRRCGIARRDSTPSLSHIPFAPTRATKTDATDKESHSFIAAWRLISILIRFGILSSTNLKCVQMSQLDK